MNRRNFLRFAAIAPTLALAPMESAPVDDRPYAQWYFGREKYGEWAVWSDEAWPDYPHATSTTICVGIHGSEEEAYQRCKAHLERYYAKTRNIIIFSEAF